MFVSLHNTFKSVIQTPKTQFDYGKRRTFLQFFLVNLHWMVNQYNRSNFLCKTKRARERERDLAETWGVVGFEFFNRERKPGDRWIKRESTQHRNKKIISHNLTENISQSTNENFFFESWPYNIIEGLMRSGGYIYIYIYIYCKICERIGT